MPKSKRTSVKAGQRGQHTSAKNRAKAWHNTWYVKDACGNIFGYGSEKEAVRHANSSEGLRAYRSATTVILLPHKEEVSDGK